MHARQSSRLDTLQSARAFLQQNTARLPNVAASGMQKALDDALAELTTHSEGQASHRLVAMGTTQRLASLRQTLLRDHMAPVAGVAAARLPGTPELAPLRLPAKRLSLPNLALAAGAMAAAAAPFSQVFLDAGLPPDFMTQLTATADAMIASREQQKQSQGRRSGATKGLDAQLREGRRALNALNKFVVSALKDDPALLANWNALTRVRQAPGPRRVITPPVAGSAAGGSVVSGDVRDGHVRRLGALRHRQEPRRHHWLQHRPV